MMKIRHCTVAAAMVAGLIAGCGGSGPRLVSVKGTVTLDGKPLEGAVIAFHPDPSNKDGQPGEDITGESGNYMVSTKGRFGLVPGKYHVSVTKMEVAAANLSADFKDDPNSVRHEICDISTQANLALKGRKRGFRKDFRHRICAFSTQVHLAVILAGPWEWQNAQQNL
ncbi:hypothetical protein SAMN05444166_1309 [Singulisphaera sp. GP187]|nr:hypothetical protein SAMN05444166_1309 [Singulisphaera sp. GP187]